MMASLSIYMLKPAYLDIIPSTAYNRDVYSEKITLNPTSLSGHLGPLNTSI